MIYTTNSGDTFDKIALEKLNDEKLAGIIIEANIDYAHIVIFESGVKLTIPEPSEQQSTHLPPWKRGDS
ncbi:phage tail protein [Anaerobacillus sp. MEB173]|uniref:phage tail protein n=1 Tax=Anaerobacillus sp. MEB173 TaxID=3383345 RepID=UPI003F911E77